MHQLIKVARVSANAALALSLAASGLFAFAPQALGDISPTGCLNNDFVVNLNKSTALAYDETNPNGATMITYSVDAGNPQDGGGKGCNVDNVTINVTDPHGVVHLIQSGGNYPIGTAVATLPTTVSYIAASADEITSKLTAHVHATGDLHDTPSGTDPLDISKTNSVTVIHPNTTVTITPSKTAVASGGTVDLTITEQNTGDDPLSNPSVTVDNGVGTLTKASGSFQGGDTNNDGKLSIGETWSWKVTGVTISSNTTFTAIGTGTDDLGNPVTSPNYANEKAQTTVQVANAKISITPNGTNEVNHKHVFTGHVDVDSGSGFANAPDGTVISFSAASGPGTFDTPSCTTAGGTGSCTDGLTSATTGITTVNATTDVTVSGVPLHRTTDSTNGSSGPATKTWVDLQIKIDANSTNEVGVDHTFTVTVNKDIGDGNGFVPDSGVTVTPGVSGTGSLTGTGTCQTGTTNGSGQCTIIVHSTNPGIATVSATASASVAGSATITRALGDGKSGDGAQATKTWVDANISLSPSSATDPVGDQHVLTVTIKINDGSGAGYVNAPDGTVANLSTDFGNLATPTCTTSGGTGTCTDTLTAPSAGTSHINASTSVVVGGVTLNRSTGDAKPGDGANAVKNWTQTTISTTASGTVTVGGKIHDVAHLGGLNNATTGHVTFNLYGPNDATCATSIATLSATPDPVTANGDYTSADFSTLSAGTYRWIAHYSGDASNNAISTKCNDEAESVVVTPATPSLTTTASQTVPVGSNISDVAHLTGGVNPTGHVTFDVFAGTDSTCTTPLNGSPIAATPDPVAGNGDYTSANFAANTAQTYKWIAHYSGDANNAAISTSCNDTNESVVVSPKTPTITTTLSATTGSPGDVVHDSAKLTGATGNAGGTVSYAVYTDSSCTVLNANQPTGNPVTVTNAGVPDSGPVTFSATGDYFWQATYSGDVNNTGPVKSTCTDEHLVISQGTPTLTTTASQTVPVGGNISDVAHLAGGNSPQGTVTFDVYGPGDTTCTTKLNGSPIAATTNPGGDGDYTSNTFVANTVGTYEWIAHYTSSDAKNANVSTACNEANESVAVTQLKPSISTTLSTTTVAIGTHVHDGATLTGATGDAGGTVTYNVYAGNVCSGATAFTDTEPVTSGAVTNSADFVPSASGTYNWQAVYSGDAKNAGATSACGTETLTVGKTGPTINTTPNPATANIGATLKDSATLSGGTNPTGNISFTLYAPADSTCSTAQDTETVTVNGNGAYSTPVGFVSNAAGTWHWKAAYSGDSNNLAVTSGCQDEPVTVNSFNATMTTAIHQGATDSGTPVVVTTVPTGTSVHDSAAISFGSGPVPTGTVNFTFFSGAGASTCSVDTGHPVAAGSAAINGSGIADPSTAEGPLAAGSYGFTATWAGDGNYPKGATSACEPLTVTQAQPLINTTPNPASGNIGTNLKDSATLTGGTNPTGTITFTLYNPADSTCSSAVDTETATVNGNGTYNTPVGFISTTAGTYHWKASYGGDANNISATSGCLDEPVTIGKNAPTLGTTPNPTSGNVGAVLNDSATLTGGSSPTGNISFSLFQPSDATCQGPAVFTQSDAISGGSAQTTGGYTSLVSGTYHWTAHYGGDTNNGSADSGCQAEPVTIGKITPTIATQLSTTTVAVNTPVTDGATLTGATSDAGGTVTYNVYSGNACTGTPTFTNQQAVTNASVPNSTAFTPSTAGTYNWQAVYSGDAKNGGATSACQSEVLTVVQPVAQYCSPGYWKQPQHFHSYVGTGFAPTDSFDTVFGVNAFSPTTKSLVQVLSTGGGGLNMLGRAAVGALMNSASLQNPLSTAQVISIFDNAFAAGTDTAYQNAANQFTFPENCPLN